MTMQQVFDQWAQPLLLTAPQPTPVRDALRGGEHCARTVRAVMARARTIDGVPCLDLAVEDARALVTGLDHRFLIADLSKPGGHGLPHGEHEIDLRQSA